jgi:hypothetical protein
MARKLPVPNSTTAAIAAEVSRTVDAAGIPRSTTWNSRYKAEP